MNFIINCSNLKQGGGLQVGDSVCRELVNYSHHHFIVVLSTAFNETASAVRDYPNVEVVIHDIKNDLRTILLGRDALLDSIVKEKKIDAVLTIFGPSRWRPRCKHLCGFARAQLLIGSEFISSSSFISGLKQLFKYNIWKWAFKRSSNTFFTENQYISDMLPGLLGDVKVYTVTNYYNQVFDECEKWKEKRLPAFEGTTLLTISNAYPHKNMEIAAAVSHILVNKYPDFNFRFVFSIEREQYHADINGIEDHFVFLGKVNIKECPSLYKQCDIAFQPTLMECFTATYPEAMRMGVPIVTTDLEFARGLCGDAACYYRAIDAEAAAKAIYKVATEKEYSSRLVENGRRQLLTYDNYEQRAEKLLSILEEIARK